MEKILKTMAKLLRLRIVGKNVVPSIAPFHALGVILQSEEYFTWGIRDLDTWGVTPKGDLCRRIGVHYVTKTQNQEVVWSECVCNCEPTWPQHPPSLAPPISEWGAA